MSDNLPALPYPAAEATMDLCADHEGPVEAMQYPPEGTLLFTADQLRAAVAAERALWQEDAERYRWLMMDLGWSVSYRRKPNRPNEYRMRHEGIFWGQWHHSAAAAIDAARKA